jgi:DNA helicase-4
MGAKWRPSRWGRRVTKCSDWQLELAGGVVIITGDVEPFGTGVERIGEVVVNRGAFWSTVEIAHPDRRIRLRGIPNRRAAKLAGTVRAARADVLHRMRVQSLIVEFDVAAGHLLSWVADLERTAATTLESRGWLAREFFEEWAAAKAAIGFGRLIADPDLQDHISRSDAAASLEIWRYELADFITQQNEYHLAVQLEACRDFFETVEKSPLTPEQARAVVCFDNRMLVVASAGSGKTSTMVAKAGYALHRKLIPADKILMLAFNADAAKELQNRTRERLSPLGLDADKVVARTFHAFGMDVIAQATGTKPSLAPWLDAGGDITQLGRIVEQLRRIDPVFRTQWDFFRAVLAKDYPDDAVDPEEKTAALVFRTGQGELVKSPGERMIADWLYFHGVEYIYERPYEIDTATAEYRQYHPDFYYPAIDAYHEHWALDKDGVPPEEFTGYLDGVHWKRATHQQHGTTLLETTMAELWSGTALDHLAKELTERGIRLEPNPDRLLAGQLPIENARLLQTFRSFLTHAKSNRLTDGQLIARLHAQPEGQIRFRDEAFLRLFTTIRAEWEKKLGADGCIDFEDMLNLSADCLEAGEWESPYQLVMVDEFQDASNARARLAKALVAEPGRHLFAVGDDWQSINRFAGADLSVMTNFEDWFGPSSVLRLERTFRFPQSIADASSRFVLQNPSQLVKTVLSSTMEFPPTIGAVSVDNEASVKAAIRHRLKSLHTYVGTGTIPVADGRRLTVLVLGRYRHQSDYMPECGDLSDRLDVRFMTMHGSKGAEADYIVIPGLVRGKWGFPSTIPNDPVLRLAMPEPEDYPRAEERRLFYVAMTRARRGVLLVTVNKRESPFLMELIRDHDVVRTNAIGEVLDSIVCPKCSRGFMVERSSKRGAFLGCAQYPRCKTVVPLADAAPAQILLKQQHRGGRS